MKQAWQESVCRAFPEGHAPSFPGYPLLGAESATPGLIAPARPWLARLVLRSAFSSEQLIALLEDVQQVRLVGSAASLAAQISTESVELYLEAEAENAWSFTSQQEVMLGPSLRSERLNWSRGSQSLVEQVVLVDRQVLRNLALLRDLPTHDPQVDRWVVRSSLSASGEAEGLIGDTLAYWTGAVAGVAVLEVAQEPDEAFETLWTRLNILRLLRWEAELGDPGDALGGAGLFEELARHTLGASPGARSAIPNLRHSQETGLAL